MRIEDYAIVVNANSNSKDIWEMFFGQFEKFYPNQKIYVFSDIEDSIISKYTVIKYDPSEMFRSQYLKCIKQVKEDFVLYLNDDYILYDRVDEEKIKDCLKILQENDNISCIRFTRGPNFTNKKFKDNLYYLTHNQEYFYSQTASLWRRDILEKIHFLGPNKHIGVKGETHGHFESDANKICKDLDLLGLIYFDNEQKRGGHYDSKIFPYIASALVKGHWNISEYLDELSQLIKDYKIDITKRKFI